MPLLYFAITMALFTLQRAVVAWGLADRFADAGAGDVWHGFLVGLRYDFSVAMLLLAPLIAICTLTSPRWLASGWWRTLVAGYVAVTLSLVLFTLIADYYFFEEFSERLNHKALNYLEFAYTYKLIWDEYPVVWALLATASLLAGLTWALRKPAVQGRDYTCPLPRIIIWLVIVIPLIVLGIRGGVGQKGLNTGAAYFTESNNVAQLTLNGLYTLRDAVISRTWRQRELGPHIPKIDDDEALAIAAALYTQPTDTPVGDPRNPLRRITDTGRPRKNHNVVLVVLESLHWAYHGSLGATESLTPHMDKLAAEGLLMERCFAVGTRTTRGFSGIVSAFPDLPGRSVTTRIEAQGNFLTLGGVLKRRGYETLFVYGGDPLYDHRQAFLGSNGFDRTVCWNELESKTFKTHLGWCDEDMYAQALREFDRAHARGKPFGAVCLTLSFHRPYDIPEGKVAPSDPSNKDAKKLDCVRYTDWAIGNFIDQARGKPWFDDTIFVFVADHFGGFREGTINATTFRVPFLIYAPGVLGERNGTRVKSVCSQTDVVPTILSLLGGKYEHCFFGSSVLDRPAERGFALMQRDSGLAMLVDADERVLVLPPSGEASLLEYEVPETLTPVEGAGAAARREEMVHRVGAIITAAEALFERGAYQVGEER